jgi:hypothetical protein
MSGQAGGATAEIEEEGQPACVAELLDREYVARGSP